MGYVTVYQGIQDGQKDRGIFDDIWVHPNLVEEAKTAKGTPMHE